MGVDICIFGYMYDVFYRSIDNIIFINLGVLIG